ncbi:MAG: ribonuclease III [Desulfobulbaceae bacterium]|jgi:ribonuclease-3|nr:ribonuclease III [Desulfobulbaceae bacterium]
MTSTLDALILANKARLSALEGRLGYRFIDLRLLQRALAHSSFAFEQGKTAEHNEVLEFLGDAVLGLLVGHLLIERYPELREGELTRLRAAVVNEKHLAHLARQIELGEYLCLGKGEEASGGRAKPSILASAFEAVFGAVFEDGGFASARALAMALLTPDFDEHRQRFLTDDSKSLLQESLREKYHEEPVYRLEKEDGPAHHKHYTVSVLLRGEVLGVGEAGSKKEAEKKAAAESLAWLRQSAG